MNAETVNPSAPVAAFLYRASAYQLDPQPGRDDPGTWYVTCPVHRDRRVRLDQDVTGDGWLHPCGRGCLPGETLDRLRHPDWPPADPAAVRVRGYVHPSRRAELRQRARQASEALHAPDGPGRGWGVLDLPARLGRLRKLLDAHYPGKRSDRYQCPSCGAPGDGHGLHVGIGRDGSSIFITCYACKQTGEIMAELGLSGEDLGWSKPLPAKGSSNSADPMPGEPWSELGYARRLVHVYGDRLRYVPAWRRWLIWDGTRWAPDVDGQAQRWMKVTARQITTTAMAIADKDARISAVRLARQGERRSAVSGALELASTEEMVAVTPERLDVDPFLLNCTNGTLDLRTMELRPHDPVDLLTKTTGAAYDPDAAGPEFGKFLGRVQPDEAMRAFLGRLLGHALAGRQTKHILPILHGAGANGKGTLVTVVLATLGDYAAPADPELLTARTFEAHPTGVADLFGLRLAVLHETDSGRRLAEGTVKRLTGGDRVKARRMREDFWWFDPSHTFLMLTNHRPIVTGTDEGIWRRLRLVPFDVVVPPAERDEELGARLDLERGAVLAWLVDGYRQWQTQGLAEPGRVVEATAEYRAESDALGRFLDERCLLASGFRTQSAQLYHAWAEWCRGQGEEEGTDKAFTAALKNRGFDTTKADHGRAFWSGIGLAADDES